ncbi:MAG TPA: GTPase ObgE [Candidatus Saccharimonadales bacterium]|jgi:GTP-binding protein|nr:GTPase ObgE [Candidatus Saccharimonadales bacterium]
MFLDRARLVVKGGDGGRGVISFRREAHVPRGGPDGGDGGRGGSVVLRVDSGMTTLSDFRFRSRLEAEDGAAGGGKNKSGRAGADLVVRVPEGTIVVDRATGERVADLMTPDEEIVVARGGQGGKGNARFVSSTRRVPRIAEDGSPGESHELDLELKLIADVGLVGLPNAGKSSLLAALTRATPKIAAYPFTTLAPNLGVARLEDRELVIADIPGLIEGAHTGAGLGEEFLRHIERTRLIVHVVDLALEDPIADIAVVDAELSAYGQGLMERRRLFALNKLDLFEARERAVAVTKRLGTDAIAVSALTGEHIPDLLKRIFAACAPREVVASRAVGERRIVFAGGGRDWTVKKERDGFRVSGDRVERLATGIDWESPDAAAYFQLLLQKNGVEKELRRLGVRSGDTVHIGSKVLEWTEGGTA